MIIEANLDAVSDLFRMCLFQGGTARNQTIKTTQPQQIRQIGQEKKAGTGAYEAMETVC